MTSLETMFLLLSLLSLTGAQMISNKQSEKNSMPQSPQMITTLLQQAPAVNSMFVAKPLNPQNPRPDLGETSQVIGPTARNHNVMNSNVSHLHDIDEDDLDEDDIDEDDLETVAGQTVLIRNMDNNKPNAQSLATFSTNILEEKKHHNFRGKATVENPNRFGALKPLEIKKDIRSQQQKPADGSGSVFETVSLRNSLDGRDSLDVLGTSSKFDLNSIIYQKPHQQSNSQMCRRIARI